LNFRTKFNAVLRVPEKLQWKITLLHIASLNCQMEVIRLLVERRADIKLHNAKKETVLHLAATAGNY
jgi:ankyrin repeat protein